MYLHSLPDRVGGPVILSVMMFRLRRPLAEMPVGTRDRRSNVTTKSPATNKARKQKAACAEISECIQRDGLRRS